MDTHLDRREVLIGFAAVGGAVAVAACSRGDMGSAAPDSAETAHPEPTTSRTGTGAPRTPAIVSLAALTVGTAVSAETPDGDPIVVTRTGSRTAVAFSAVCTHQGCTVQPSGDTLKCPCHSSRFNAHTGAVIQGPAQSPLPEYPVAVRNNGVYPA